MNIPLSIDETDPKWNLLKNIMDIISSRRVKQVMAKLGIKPVNKAGQRFLRWVFIAMFFSLDISYVVNELTKREELRRFAKVVDVPDVEYIYRFLKLCSMKNSSFILWLTNRVGGWRAYASFWLRKKISCEGSGVKRVQMGVFQYPWYYIGFKLALAIEYTSMKPLAFLLTPEDRPMMLRSMKR